VQVGLMMGQLAFALLLGFAVFVRLADHGRPFGSALALLAWTTRPQVLPVLLLALALGRHWRTLLWLCALPVLLSIPVVLVGGWSVISDYSALGLGAGLGVLTLEGTHLDPGHSLLGLAQRLLGPGWAANGLAILGSLGVFVLVGSLWRRGLHTDARRHIQLAVLPLAAVLSSPHSATYDAVLWLASAWLLLRLVGEVPRTRSAVMLLLLVGWWGGSLASLPLVNEGVPWGAVSAVFDLVGLAWLYRQTLVVTPSACRRPTPP
jgi:hypothetical protein